MDTWGQPNRPARTEPVEIDTRHLRTLLTLLEQGSVTRAALALGISQPAVSQMLRRMRELTGDQLLVRSGARMVPTARAHAMVEPIRRSLDVLDEAIRPPQAFAPDTSDHVFRIATADCMEALFLPRLITLIRRNAPATRIMVRSVVAGYDYVAALEAGELDVVIANWRSAPDNLRTVRLLEDEMVCMFGPDHPLNVARGLTIDSYMALKHVAPTPLSSSVPGPIDGRLAELGLTRDIQVMLPEFNLVPYVLMSSDLVFTSSRNFAQHYRDFLPIRSLPAPAPLGRMQFQLLWHERSQDSPPHRWLRDQMTSLSRRIEAELAEN